MARTAVTTCLLLAWVSAAPAQSGKSVAPKRGDVAGTTLEKALDSVRGWSGLAIETAGADSKKPVTLAPLKNVSFWTALDSLASHSGHRIILGSKGQRIALVKHTDSPIVSSVDGPFRFVVREVVAKRDADNGAVSYEVRLDVHWEPRFPVFRLSNLTVTTAVDDKGTKLTPTNDAGKVPTSGYLHSMTIRLGGVPRAATRIARLDGTITVTAAEKMLRFAFEDPFKTPKKMSDSGVTVTLARLEKKVDGLWESRVELEYPPGQPVFETFERWLSDNRCQLADPDKGKTFSPTDYELPDGASLVVLYRFKEDSAKGLTPTKGWSFEYETPSPLMEYAVKFSLKDIDLP